MPGILIKILAESHMAFDWEILKIDIRVHTDGPALINFLLFLKHSA